MPFDPRLVPEETAPINDDHEIALDGQLEALADQLRNEAEVLAKAYPGSHTNSADSVAAATTSPSMWRGILAASVALAPIVAGLVFFSTLSSHRPAASGTVGAIDQATERANRMATFPSVAPYRLTPTQLTPALVPDVSSPELEGVLDVLETNPETPQRLSI